MGFNSGFKGLNEHPGFSNRSETMVLSKAVSETRRGNAVVIVVSSGQSKVGL